ncbi:MAG TPA: DUF4446 family protein [Symbiobacteriaceae bacterium]|nr:DUF4446 family protein [Symbiobacteriaceae bacterium]
MDAAINVDAVLVSLVAVGLAFLVLIIVIILAISQRKFLARYRLLLNGPAGHDLEQLLLNQAAEIESLQSDLIRLTRQLDAMETASRLHVQKTAIIRFNAFPDTGSDLSFAIALLDADDNGMVVSSLYGRSESRIYAKPILAGQSTYQLSNEEKEALAKARRLPA